LLTTDNDQQHGGQFGHAGLLRLVLPVVKPVAGTWFHFLKAKTALRRPIQICDSEHSNFDSDEGSNGGKTAQNHNIPIASDLGLAGLRSSIEGVYNSMSFARQKPAF
jgi:hypothetical protein